LMTEAMRPVLAKNKVFSPENSTRGTGSRDDGPATILVAG